MTTNPPMLAWMTSLADATRARALRLLERNELAVAELCSVLRLPQSTVSRHLKVLADEGWVAARSEGTSRLYRMAADRLDPAARRLWALLREQTGRMPGADQDDQRLGRVLADRKTQSQAFFSSAAGQWDRLRGEMFGRRFDLVALGGLMDDEWVAGDLGCGTGQIAETLASFVRRVVAVESSRQMMAAARRRLGGVANVEVRSGELEALPLEDRELDAAVISLVLHHVAEPLVVLREAARVLRPGGRLLVIDMFRHEHVDYQRQMGHVWLGFERDQITGWMSEAGFERVRVQPLPVDKEARGPALFAATGRRLVDTTATQVRKTNEPRRNGRERRGEINGH